MIKKATNLSPGVNPPAAAAKASETPAAKNSSESQAPRYREVDSSHTLFAFEKAPRHGSGTPVTIDLGNGRTVTRWMLDPKEPVQIRHPSLKGLLEFHPWALGVRATYVPEPGERIATALDNSVFNAKSISSPIIDVSLHHPDLPAIRKLTVGSDGKVTATRPLGVSFREYVSDVARAGESHRVAFDLTPWDKDGVKLFEPREGFVEAGKLVVSVPQEFRPHDSLSYLADDVATVAAAANKTLTLRFANGDELLVTPEKRYLLAGPWNIDKAAHYANLLSLVSGIQVPQNFTAKFEYEVYPGGEMNLRGEDVFTALNQGAPAALFGAERLRRDVVFLPAEIQGKCAQIVAHPDQSATLIPGFLTAEQTAKARADLFAACPTLKSVTVGDQVFTRPN